MKSPKDIGNALREIQRQDAQCPTEAHKLGKTCFDAGHAIRGTWISVLLWVLDKKPAPWE